MSCGGWRKQFPGPQDSLADALEGGLPADTAAVSVDAALERERECEGTETSHRAKWHLHSLHWKACVLQRDPGPGKYPPQPREVTPPCLLGNSKLGPSTRAGPPYSAVS